MDTTINEDKLHHHHHNENGDAVDGEAASTGTYSEPDNTKESESTELADDVPGGEEAATTSSSSKGEKDVRPKDHKEHKAGKKKKKKKGLDDYFVRWIGCTV